MKSDKIKKLWADWLNVRASAGFRKVLTYLIFVFIAALFWFILALNDNIQDDFEVKVNIYNVPDSVTFINLPPDRIHVTVRDKGTSLWRAGVFSRPTVNINFRDYGADGVFRMNRSELTAGLKNVFGGSASLISSSVDSLSLVYTTLPGKRVPLVLNAELTAAAGKVISGKPHLDPGYAMVYSTRDMLDTILRVHTQRLVRRDLEESVEVPIKVTPIRGVRIEPATVNVTVNVEPLVRKEVTANIRIDNVPSGMDLLLFPANVKVEYFVPMSAFSKNTSAPEVIVDYRDLKPGGRSLPLHLGRYGSDMVNVRILADSVEYTIVRN